MSVITLFHRLHESSAIFGCHQGTNFLMMAILFFFGSGGFDAEGTAVAMEVEFDLLDEFRLLVVDVINVLPLLNSL